MFLLLTLPLLTFTIHVQSAKILVVPMDHPGHINVFIMSGQALSARGHDVYLLTMEKNRKKVEDAGLKAICHQPSPQALSNVDDPEVGESLKSILTHPVKTPMALSRVWAQVVKQCEDLLKNKEIEQKINEIQFDIALVEGLLPGRCFLTIPYRHSLRYVSLSDIAMEPWDARVPSVPSVEPLFMTTFTNKMSFLQRFANFLVNIFFRFIIKPFAFNPDYLIEKYIPEKPKISLSELYQKSELMFNTVEIILMDYPRISALHYIYVGSIGGSNPKPLKPDLEDFVSSAKEGFILVSFGSMMQKLPEEYIIKMLSVFEHFPSKKFVMRSHMKKNIPVNVKVMDWLPQNDLLGHTNVKLFITHGGNNGQMEGLYHGVPMIVCPLFGDQPYNAVRLVNRRYGQALDLKNDTPEKMIEIIQEVLENPVYTENIKNASEIYKALPKANETVAYWVDHVLRFGSDHLRPSYIDMPLYQFFMLDILTFLAVIIFFTVLLFYKCCKCCYRRMCTKKPKTE